MLINGIDFPLDILKAINDDNFVIFAGAGVSKDAPSNLPDFKGLAEEIGRLCGKDYPEEDEIDEFLGDLERENVKVKDYVANVLSARKSRPNSFHKNILNLFRTPEAIRIVTTNQDELFEAAINEMGFKDIHEYSAPALPYGNDFSGIIHIHGKVSDPKHIVVTDTDFGNAYMLNGFATNFLIELFSRYVVLFVGYSYNDRIVRYLTTAITSKNISNAFILSDNISPKQKRTGIIGIKYGKNNHQQMCNALGIIGEYTKRGIFDWQQRISNLNLDTPPIDNETRDELLEGIKQLAIQKHFCSVIKGQDWPEWLDNYKVLDNLFGEQTPLSEQDDVWAYWLASNYLDDKLLTLIEKHKGKVNKEFCNIIFSQFQSQEERFTNELFCQYVSLLLDKVTEEYELYRIICIANTRKLDDVKWSVFWNMLKYQIILEKPFLYKTENWNYMVKQNWNCSDGLVRTVWKNELSGQIIDARSTFVTCVKIIGDLYKRISCWTLQKNTYALDYLDIENNEKSYHSNDIELVICEICEKAFQEINNINSPLAFELILDLLSSDYALLRRMSLLFLRRYCQNDAMRVIDVLLSHFTLHELEEREQIFKLVAKFFDDIGDEKRKQVIDKIWNVNVDGMDFATNEDKERHIYYTRYNWLKWLESKSNHINEIVDRLSIIHRIYPDFMPRERPDLIISPTITKWGSESPISKEELSALSYKDACDFILNYKDNHSIMGPDRYGLLQTVTDLCQKNTRWGINFINELKSRDYWENELWDSIFRGLARGIEKKRVFTSTINCIEDKLIINCGRSIASFIYDVISKENFSNEITDNLIINLVKLVKRMWPFREVSKIDGISAVEASLNCTTGILTHILMYLMCLKPRERLIPSWLDSIVKKQIEESEYLEEYISVICGYAAQLFYRSPEWTRRHVLKYLDDDNNGNKKAAWDGFLAMVSNFNVEFGNEVLPYFDRNTHFISDIESKYKSRFIHDYSLLMVYITDDPTTTHLSELFKVMDDKDRNHFARSIAIFLEKMKPDEKSALWNRWLKKYWCNRNINIPIALSSEEYIQMLFWLIGLPEYEEGIDIALESNVKHISPNMFLHAIIGTDMPKQYPEKTALLVINLIKKSDRRYIDSKIRGLLFDLRNKVEPNIRTEIDNILGY